VPEQFLDRSEVGSALEQVGGERVSERVWVKVADSGNQC
jgi:hypothetical protein